MFNKVKELLEANKIDNEVATILDSEIQAELKKLRDEAKQYRLEKEELAKSFDEIVKSKEAIESKVADIDKKIAQAKEEGKAELVKTLEAEKQANQELQANIQQLQQANIDLKLTNAITGELSKYNIKKDVVEDLGLLLKSKISVGDDGSVDGVGDIVKTFLDERPTYLAPTTNGGTGAGSNGNAGNGSVGNLGGSTSERIAAIKQRIENGNN